MKKIFIVFLFFVVVGLGYSIFGLPSNINGCYTYLGEERALCYYRQSLYQIALDNQAGAESSCLAIANDPSINENVSNKYNMAYNCITNVAKEFGNESVCISVLLVTPPKDVMLNKGRAIKEDCESQVANKNILKRQYDNGRACAPLFILLGLGSFLIFRV